MASRSTCFLGSLLVLLFCHDAALSQTTETPATSDVKTLKAMRANVIKRLLSPGQFAVIHIPGGNLSNCHEMQYNDETGFDENCNFYKFVNVTFTKGKETFRHAEWQLINKALRPMFRKWRGPRGTMCPPTLYLYSYLAPDYSLPRKGFSYTCTHEIAHTITKIFRNAECEQTRIVVGYTKVYERSNACSGKTLLDAQGIIHYHLESQPPNYQLDCSAGALPGSPPQPGPSKPRPGSPKPGKAANRNG